MLNIKLNRRLFAEEEFDDLERLMSTYSLCQSKRSGKTFLIATKCKKNTWWYCVYAFIIPFCIGSNKKCFARTLALAKGISSHKSFQIIKLLFCEKPPIQFYIYHGIISRIFYRFVTTCCLWQQSTVILYHRPVIITSKVKRKVCKKLIL